MKGLTKINNEFKALFGTECIIIEKPDYIEVFSIQPGIVVQEIIMKCKKTNSGWTVFKCSRGSDFKIGTFAEKEYALCVLYIYYAKLYLEPETNHKFLKILRKYENYNELSEACNLIETKCEAKYFSPEIPKKDTVCLDYTNNLFTIYYIKEDNTKIKIVECEQFSRAICVLYNYAIALRNFKHFYSKVSKVNKTCENKYEELLQYYFGHRW